MDCLGWFVKVFLVAVIAFALNRYFNSETAPKYSFVEESTSAPQVSYYDYIIVGGGTAGCPLAATLSENANVLVLERGGSPYVNPSKADKDNFLTTLLDPSPDSYAQGFTSEDGVYNHRARVLGGASVFNAGFYSHAETDFVVEAGLDEGLVNDSYRWVENKLVFEPTVLEWQSSVRDGLLEAGVLQFNGFTNAHIEGTKIGATIFDKDGRRHSAADLLEYADPTKIKVYLHATAQKIILSEQIGSRPRAMGLIFEDASGVRHTAFLTQHPKSEIILTAGTIGSTQLLLLSGIGPANQLASLGIDVVIDQPMVGQELADNPLNAVFVPSPIPVELSLVSIAGITQFGSYVEPAGSGLNLLPPWVQMISDNLFDILNQTGGNVGTDSFPDIRIQGGVIIEKVRGPISKGYLELTSTNPNDNPKVRFNYFQAPEDLEKCVQGMETLINVLNSKAFSKFRFGIISTQDLLSLMALVPVNQRPRHLNTSTSLEQYCIDTVMTMWHYHGGCCVGKVVDQDFKVLGVDSLRVVDSSTFKISPGTNPQATVMMLGRYMGVRINSERQTFVETKVAGSPPFKVE